MAAQEVQIEAPDTEIVAPVQGTHTLPLLKVPAGHAKHAFDELAFGSEEKPAWHCVQLLTAPAAEYVPAAHTRHAEPER